MRLRSDVESMDSDNSTINRDRSSENADGDGDADEGHRSRYSRRHADHPLFIVFREGIGNDVIVGKSIRPPGIDRRAPNSQTSLFPAFRIAPGQPIFAVNIPERLKMLWRRVGAQ